MLIRRASLSDVEDILAICERCIREINRKFITEEKMFLHLQLMNLQHFETRINTGHYYAMFGEDSKVLGACGLQLKGEGRNINPWISSFFVNPDYIRRGIGSQLMNRLENDEWWNMSGSVHVRSSEYGIPFYESFKFVKAEDEIHKIYNSIHMTRLL